MHRQPFDCNTDIGRTEVGTAVKDGDKGKEVQQPEEPKGKGTSLIRLPKFTKGLGRVVEPHEPSAGSKGKGKAVEQSEPPDAEGKGKAVELSKPQDAKGKAKTSEPSDHCDSKSKDKAVQTTALPGIEDKVERVQMPDNEDHDKVVAQAFKSVTSSRGGSKIAKPGAETEGGSSKAGSKLAKKLKADNQRLQAELEFLLKGAEDRMRHDSRDQVRMPSSECKDKPAEPPALSVTKDKCTVVEPPRPPGTQGKAKDAELPGPLDNKGKDKADKPPGPPPDIKGKGIAVEPSVPPDRKGKGKVAQQAERPDAKGKGKTAEEQKQQQGTAI
jgi:hypothetical protein